ncbi:MAG: outer membrane protein transport protein [Acidobacteriota bacterium]|nr:outer membrane protein transport protein [Acidobacteriota bacterium]
MRRRGVLICKALGLTLLAAAAASPARAAGFAIFEQGAKSLGMAGAFSAQADDPTALFFNAGGLAFVDHRAYSVGATYITTSKASFVGANPFPGTGVTADQKKLSVFPPHVYVVQPINQQWKVGLGIETPFGLTTEWKDPHSFAGRFLSTKAALQAFDINPTIAYQVSPQLGIGVGFLARVSNVELDRDAPAINPFTLSVVSAASVKLKGDYSTGYGFNVGILDKPTDWLSLGAWYRSQITVDYTGNAVLSAVPTGNAQLDAAIAAQLPLGRKLPVKTSIAYPDTAGIGLAFKVMPSLVVETDGGWSGWSHFKEVQIRFTNHDLPDSTVPEGWKDAYSVRVGLNWTQSASNQWRLGYVYDQTPQPEVTVNPLLPDNNRNGVTAGYGWKGSSIGLDLAAMYLNLGSRTRAKSLPPPDSFDFFGTYKTRAWLFSATLSFF